MLWQKEWFLEIHNHSNHTCFSLDGDLTITFIQHWDRILLFCEFTFFYISCIYRTYNNDVTKQTK
jgi:hypothetical protein